MNKENVKVIIQAYQALLELMNKEEKYLTLAQITFRKYVELESTPEVAKYLRFQGHRMPNGNSIQTVHVSEIIKSNPKDVDHGIVNITLSIFNKNSRAAMHWD